MSTKLESVNEHVMYIRNDGELRALLRGDVASLVSAIDAGHIDALRHYAKHGTLSPKSPVWPGLTVEQTSSGWTIYRRGVFVATVLPCTESTGWRSTVDGGHSFAPHSTPQAAVDAARAWLAERWGLST